jgi:hypothetical protein
MSSFGRLTSSSCMGHPPTSYNDAPIHGRHGDSRPTRRFTRMSRPAPVFHVSPSVQVSLIVTRALIAPFLSCKFPSRKFSSREFPSCQFPSCEFSSHELSLRKFPSHEFPSHKFPSHKFPSHKFPSRLQYSMQKFSLSLYEIDESLKHESDSISEQ